MLQILYALSLPKEFMFKRNLTSSAWFAHISFMNTLNLKPTHSVVSAYYQELQQLRRLDQDKEGAVSPAFAALLRHCGRQVG